MSMLTNMSKDMERRAREITEEHLRKILAQFAGLELTPALASEIRSAMVRALESEEFQRKLTIVTLDIPKRLLVGDEWDDSALLFCQTKIRMNERMGYGFPLRLHVRGRRQLKTKGTVMYGKPSCRQGRDSGRRGL